MSWCNSERSKTVGAFFRLVFLECLPMVNRQARNRYHDSIPRIECNASFGIDSPAGQPFDQLANATKRDFNDLADKVNAALVYKITIIHLSRATLCRFFIKGKIFFQRFRASTNLFCLYR
jgi:hypothetical protein